MDELDGMAALTKEDRMMLRPDKDADEIARLKAELAQAQARETRLRDALTIIATSAYPNRKLHDGDHLWRWCRAEDTARQALIETQEGG